MTTLAYILAVVTVMVTVLREVDTCLKWLASCLRQIASVLRAARAIDKEWKKSSKRLIESRVRLDWSLPLGGIQMTICVLVFAVTAVSLGPHDLSHEDEYDLGASGHDLGAYNSTYTPSDFDVHTVEIGPHLTAGEYVAHSMAASTARVRVLSAAEYTEHGASVSGAVDLSPYR